MSELTRNIRLGIFVLAGTVFLVVVLYFIGSKRNMFNSTISVSAKFRNAEGLMSGNSVRFAGINIGTVKTVAILNDTTVEVIMHIDQDVVGNIKKTAVASIGTDGLMGNKLVNIIGGGADAMSIEEGDELTTYNPLNTSEMLRTLSLTNENMKVITDDLKDIMSRLNSNNTLWTFLSDTVLGNNLKQAVVSIKVTGERTAYVAGDLSKLVGDVKQGKGTIGALLVDTSLSSKLHQSVVKVNLISNELAEVTGDLSVVTKNMKDGKGTVGTLLMDTSFVHHMNQTMDNLNSGTKGFSDNMEALKHSIFLRRYFKKQAKKAK